MQDDSPTVDDGRGKRPRVVETGSQKMETDQVPESELPSVPEDDDLNATVIEVMTDVGLLLDGSSVIDVFAVNSARRKRVEVSERKLTESDRKLFSKAKELKLQSWLDHRVFDLVKKKFVDQERVVLGGVQDRILQPLVEETLMDETEQVIEVPKISLSATQMAEQLVEVPWVSPSSCVHVLVPQIGNELVGVRNVTSQSEFQQYTVEQTVDIPVLGGVGQGATALGGADSAAGGP